MLDLETFAYMAANQTYPYTRITDEDYIVCSPVGRRYDVNVKACGRFIYRISCSNCVTDLPQLKSRKMIANMLPSTMRALFDAVDAGMTGALELPCKVPRRTLETRYDYWDVITEHEAREEREAAEWLAGAEGRNLAFLEDLRQKRLERGPGPKGKNLFAKLAHAHGVKFEYVAGSYDQKTKTVTPCEVKLTAPVDQIFASQSDVTVLRGQSHRAGTDWLYLRTCLYNELDGMHEPKFVFDRSKYTV